MPPRRRLPSSPSPELTVTSVEEQDVPETQFEPNSEEAMYEVEAILDERMFRGQGQFLIKWAGMDPKTGEDYEPTWEPKNSCSNDLIQDWKNRKKKDPGLVGRYTKKLEDEKKEKRKRKRGSVLASSSKRSRNSIGPALKKERQTTSLTRSPTAPAKDAAPVSKTRSTRQSIAPPATPPRSVPGPSRRTRQSISTSETQSPSVPKIVIKKGKVVNPEPAGREGMSKAIIDLTSTTSSASHNAKEHSPSSAAEAPENMNSVADSPVVEINTSAAVPEVIPDTEATGKDAPNTEHGHSTTDAGEVARGSAADTTAPLPLTSVTPQDLQPQAEIAPPMPDASPSLPPVQYVASKASTPQSTPSKSPARRSRGRPKKITNLSQSPSGPGTRMSADIASPNQKLGQVRRPSPTPSRPILGNQASIINSEKSAPASQVDSIAQFSSPPRVTKTRQQRKAAVPKIVEKIIAGEVWMVDSQDQDSESQETDGDKKSRSADVADADKAPKGIAENSSSGSIPDATPSKSRKPEDELEVEVQVNDSDLDLLESPVVDRRPEVETIETTILPVSNNAHRPNHPVSLVLLQEKNDEITRLQAQIKDLTSVIEQIPPPAPPVEVNKASDAERDARIVALLAEIELMKGVIADLTSQLTASSKSRATLSEDYNFIRAQYETASNRAVEEVQRSNALAEQIKTLKQQLTLGLKQRELHNEAIQAKRDAEIRELRMTTQFLLDQARRTDDRVRKRAAGYSRLFEENEYLRNNLRETKEREERLELRNEELAEQVTILRGHQMGAFGDESGDDEDDDSFDADGDMTQSGSGSPLSNPGGATIPGRVGGINSVPSGEIGGFTPSQLMPSESQLLGDRETSQRNLTANHAGGTPGQEQDAIDEDLVEGGVGYWCKWREDVDRCTMMFDTRQDLLNHAQNHISVDTSTEELA